MKLTENRAISFTSDAIVFDPELPGDVRRLLYDGRWRYLIPFRDMLPQADRADDGGVVVAVGLAVVCFPVMVGSAVGAGFTYGLGHDWLIVLLVISAFFFFGFLGILVAEVYKRRYERRKASAAARFHRRYVVPSTDLDPESTRVWNRAITAADQISASGVVRQQLIDSVPVVAVMPYRLWDIAERLARLAMARGAQGDALYGIDPDHPDLADRVGSQRRAQDLVSADVEERVRNLEVIAGRVREADAARLREAAARRLHDIDGLHLDLLSGLGTGVAGPGMDERVIEDSDAVIERSRRAIREANEAALSLVIPGDDGRGTRS